MSDLPASSYSTSLSRISTLQVLSSHGVTRSTVPTVSTLSDVLLSRYLRLVATSMRLSTNASNDEGASEYVNVLDALQAVESVGRRGKVDMSAEALLKFVTSDTRGDTQDVAKATTAASTTNVVRRPAPFPFAVPAYPLQSSVVFVPSSKSSSSSSRVSSVPAAPAPSTRSWGSVIDVRPLPSYSPLYADDGGDLFVDAPSSSVASSSSSSSSSSSPFPAFPSSAGGGKRPRPDSSPGQQQQHQLLPPPSSQPEQPARRFVPVFLPAYPPGSWSSTDAPSSHHPVSSSAAADAVVALGNPDSLYDWGRSTGGLASVQLPFLDVRKAVMDQAAVADKVVLAGGGAFPPLATDVERGGGDKEGRAAAASIGNSSRGGADEEEQQQQQQRATQQATVPAIGVPKGTAGKRKR